MPLSCRQPLRKPGHGTLHVLCLATARVACRLPSSFPQKCARSAVSSRTPANPVAALAVVLGSDNADIPVTRGLGTRGSRASRLAKVSAWLI